MGKSARKVKYIEIETEIQSDPGESRKTGRN